MVTSIPEDQRSISVAAAAMILATNVWRFQQSTLAKCSKVVGFREIRQLKVVTDVIAFILGCFCIQRKLTNALGKFHNND